MPTQKEMIQSLYDDINNRKENGEWEANDFPTIQRSLSSLSSDVKRIETRLLNPDDGIIVKVNENTSNIETTVQKLKAVDTLTSKMGHVTEWKGSVQKALWVAYAAIVGMIIKIANDLF